MIHGSQIVLFNEIISNKTNRANEEDDNEEIEEDFAASSSSPPPPLPEKVQGHPE